MPVSLSKPRKPAPESAQALVPVEVIESKILIFRGYRVMFDRDLAKLYGVPVKRLNEQVKRNLSRFPDDFMFQLTLKEANSLLRSRSQIAAMNRGRNMKYRPYAFTEHGAVMLANVLRSPVAVRASIQVVRAFVHLRQMLATNQDLARKIEGLERKVGKHDADLLAILNVLQKLMQQPPPRRPKAQIGFVPAAEE
ncbi:MAG TPA: ORF6N domain-containing protein [Bryobacteraceae bacterium]|nr:ORF6N domain-containing protein [Bryobacteraceae bacterium]